MSIWENNLALLRRRPPNQDLLPILPTQEPEENAAEWLPGSYPALRIRGEDGRPITSNSVRNPWKEAEVLADQAQIGNKVNLVALGVGLGYHLLRLVHRLPVEQPLWIIENRRDIFMAALQAQDLSSLLTRTNTYFIVADDSRDAVHHMASRLTKNQGQLLSFWPHPPSLRAEDSFYEAVIRGVRESTPRPPLPSRGLKKDKLRVLILNTDYFLIPESMRAFKHLGHECYQIIIDKTTEHGGEVIRRILQQVADFSPDLIFTVNHLGFDREGILIDFFHRLRLPSISWYADSPRIILNLYGGTASDLAYIFVWDRHYLQDARDLGFEQVYELPLGTDPDVFRPRQVSRLTRWQTPVSFVGNSMVGPTEKKLGRLPQTQEFKQMFQQLLAIFTKFPFQRLNQVLEQANLAGHPALAKLSREQWTDLEAGLIWTTTRDYRLERVKQLTFAQPVIYGDPGWRELLSPPFQLRPEVNYYDELPLVFSGSKINFNATSLQMKTAVNQRVFDVPAVGGFLLTDFRPQLAELFEIGSEVICYQTPEEIPDLVRFYLKHPAARRRVALKARQKVLQEHTYAHRIQAMLACLRRTL